MLTLTDKSAMPCKQGWGAMARHVVDDGDTQMIIVLLSKFVGYFIDNIASLNCNLDYLYVCQLSVLKCMEILTFAWY